MCVPGDCHAVGGDTVQHTDTFDVGLIFHCQPYIITFDTIHLVYSTINYGLAYTWRKRDDGGIGGVVRCQIKTTQQNSFP